MMTILIGVSSLLGAALLAVGWVVAVADSAPNLTQLKTHNPHPPSQVFAADGELLGYIHSDTIYTAVAPNRVPLTHGVEAARRVANGATLGDVSRLLASEAAIGVVYTFLGYQVLRFMERESRKRASLQVA